MLNNFNPSEFLSQHWQKSPCLIKNALSNPPNYISAAELAGLSLEDEVESRIIRSDKQSWQIQNGPFLEDDFELLPESHWTLLVQTLDYWLPETQPLLELFRFIPRWRFDDLMVSYATDGGGVGPHFDNYDTFLIQASGQRRWRVGAKGLLTQQKNVIDGLLHLEKFPTVIDIVMQPGDILYIPPKTAHWGESIGESIGYSVGYRAPQTRDIFALLANHLDCSEENRFFNDSYRSAPNNSNKIEPELLDWAKNEIIKIANNQELIAGLLGNSLSNSKVDRVDTDQETTSILQQNIASITLFSGLNANWCEVENKLQINIEGETLYLASECSDLIEMLFSGETVDIKGLQKNQPKFDFSESLATLINMGNFLVK